MMPCPAAALTPPPALAVQGSAAAAAGTGNEVHGDRTYPAPHGDMAHTRCWVGHHSANLWAQKAEALLTKPCPLHNIGGSSW